MSRTVIIIPSRLEAKRLPNKPLLKINDIPMIIHVMNRAKESGIGEVIVATPDQKIFDLVEQMSGKAILTKKNHSTGSDRIYEALEKISDGSIDFLINLQGDMPNIDPNDIKNLDYLMRKNKYQMGTLASKVKNIEEFQNTNIVKVETFKNLHDSNFPKTKDFFRKMKNTNKKNIYHHIGVYAFSRSALSKYVKLSRTKNEIERKLEQMRALDNNIEIRVALSKSLPLGIDTKENFLSVKKTMEYKG